MKNNLGYFVSGFCLILIMFSCQQNYTPKPPGYFRIDFPNKEYQLFDSNCPFTFEYPVYTVLEQVDLHEYCRFNLNFPKYKGTIHLTYHKIDGNFDVFIEDNWSMIYKIIAQKADAVIPHIYSYPELNVHGTMYDISGDAASAVHFWVTDSINNFLKGSMYFSVRPNYDSLAPVINFFREDIIHLMETFKWKESNLLLK